MNEQRALELLSPVLRSMGNDDADQFDFTATAHATWLPGCDSALLDGTFSADELEAIAWWMRNKP